ncbi:MAG: flagellar basal body P-ring formation chaperone FlgA [Candidatus Hydrogenedentes bacterium]|nr:flagellar basal body P-ring formation chaperone FlgA [Candidatus Hydrogenedentota bacterium]
MVKICAGLSLIVLAAASVAVAAPANSVAAGAVVVFREEAYVKGPVVRLGEIAEIEGAGAAALGDVEIVAAAQPGASKRLDAGLVVARLRNAGYDRLEVEVKGAKSVEAKTLHQEITPDMIAGDLRSYIEQSMPWDPLVTEVEVVPPQQGIIAAEGEVGFAWRPSLDYAFVGQGSFRGSVTVDGAPVRTLTCKATVETYVNVVVAAATIAQGKIIMPGDVAKETRLLSSLKEPSFQNPSEVAGRFTARNSIVPGQVIGKRLVAPRVLVRRKQLVGVEMASGGLEVQTQAEAQSDAAEGEPVVCLNVNSKQPFVGVVRADGIVVVQ